MSLTELSAQPVEAEATAETAVQISGMLEYRDAEGNVLKQVPFLSSVPIEPAGE